MPLILSAPGHTPGRSRSLVELVDLFPTLSELAGLAPPPGLQGTSLVPILKDPDAVVKRNALSFVARGTSLRSPGWAYTRYADGSEELYDMKADPGQFTNLAALAEHRGTLIKHREAFDQRVQAAGLEAGRPR